MSFCLFNLVIYLLSQVSGEAKQKAAEAKSRADDAFRRKDYQAALDAYTQVNSSSDPTALRSMYSHVINPFLKCSKDGNFFRLLYQISLKIIPRNVKCSQSDLVEPLF